MLSCKHQDALGVPSKGFHRIHFGGVAVGDLLLTFLLAVGLSYIPGSPPLTLWIVILILLAEALHIGFCVNTSVMHWFNGGRWRFGIVAAIMFALLVAICVLRAIPRKSSGIH